MNTIRTRNAYQRASQLDHQRELAERAARADAIIAACCVFGLAVVIIMQLAEKVAA